MVLGHAEAGHRERGEDADRVQRDQVVDVGVLHDQQRHEADDLRHELLAEIPNADLQTCIKVLTRIRERAEKNGKLRSMGSPVYAGHDGHTRHRHSISRKRAFCTGGKEFK